MTDKLGFNAAFSELEAALADKTQMIHELQAMLKSQGEMLTLIISLVVKKEAPKRQRGRPKKNIDDDWLLAKFKEMQSEFLLANPSIPPSDDKVLNWYFVREFEKHGIVQNRTQRTAFAGKLKTMKNRISDARNPRFRNPVK